jgi:hypothetical protein
MKLSLIKRQLNLFCRYYIEERVGFTSGYNWKRIIKIRRASTSRVQNLRWWQCRFSSTMDRDLAIGFAFKYLVIQTVGRLCLWSRL